MRFRVLGPVEVLDADGGLVQLGGQKQRALLGLLLASGGRVVPVSRIIDELWGSEPPAKALVSIQSYVANLRRGLEPDRPVRAPARILVTRPPGYALVTEEVDAVEFEQLVTVAHELLPTDPRRARELLRSAADLWRGEPYEDLSGAAPGLAAAAVRLAELRLLATENGYRADLALGGHERLVGEIEQLVEAHPLRESGWGLLALALYRSQRQGEALEALRRAREVLAEELGVDPGPELRRLEKAILDHDPSLAAASIDAAALIGGSAGGGPRLSDESRLVGRDGQLTGLTGHLVNASASRGTAVLLTGEPGIGKTSLARGLAATAAAMGLKVGWGRCDGAEGAPALWAFSQALADLADHDDPPFDGVGPADPRGVADADTADFRLAQATAALLRAAGPSLLVLDDLHRADGDTLRMLQRLGAMVSDLPAVLLLTSRDSDADLTPELRHVLADLSRNGLVRMGLHGLDEDEIRSLAKLHHEVEIPAAVAGALAERTNGNPFFVGELIRLLAEQRRLTDPEAAATLQVPDGVRDVVRQRISRLPDEVEPLLAAAAVCGVTFDPDLTEAVSGQSAGTAVTAIEAALLAGLIVPDGLQYRFTHALVREAVYAGLPLGRRRQLHAALAELLQRRFRGTRLAELAHHNAQAGPAHARAAWTAAVRAAEVAARQPAPAEAARLQGLAQASVVRDNAATATERYDVLVGLARARKRAGHERQAADAAREAADVALAEGDALAAASAVVEISAGGVWSWREYQVVDYAGVALIERLLREIPPEADVIRARLLAALAGEIYYRPDEADRAVELSTAAESLVRGTDGHHHSDQGTLATVLELRHVAYERPQLLTERLSAARELVELAESADDPAALASALVFRGRDQMEQGDLAAGLRDYQRARVLAETHVHTPVLVALAWADAVLAIARGRFAEAEGAIAAAGRFHSMTTVAGAAEVPIAVAATLHLVRDTLPSIEAMLADAAASSGLSLLRDWHALSLVKSGRAAQARSELGAWPLQPDVPADYMCLTHLAIRAELWSALGSHEAAESLSEQLAPYAGRLVIGGTGITVTGYAGHQVGLLARTRGDLDGAVHHLTTALHRHEEAGLWPFAAASARELGATLRQRGGADDRGRAATLEDQANRILRPGTAVGRDDRRPPET